MAARLRRCRRRGEVTRYIQEVAGADGWSRWVQPVRKGYKMACCDCGLVHTMDFRTVSDARGKFIQFRVRRNSRATGAMRAAKTKRSKKP